MRLFKSTASKAKTNLRRGFAVLASASVLGSCAPPAEDVHIPRPATPAVDFLAQSAPTYNAITCNTANDIVTQGHMPNIGAVFTRMAQQPISGASVIQNVTNPAQRVSVCTSHLDGEDTTLIASYEASSRRLLVRPGNPGPVTVAHEAFHAHQHLNGGFYAVSSSQLLTPGDRTTGMLLIEATAAAYAQVVLFETQFSDAEYYRRSGRVNDYGMRTTFERAYTASYARNASLELQDRRRAALQDAGQAVVRALMNASSSSWASLYRPAAQRYLSLPAAHLVRESADYQANRSTFYGHIGAVGPGLQLVPAEYLGPQADATIANQHRAFRLRVPSTAPRPPVA